MYAGLVGYDDDMFHHAVCLVCSLLRKMKVPLLCKRYLENICDSMTQTSNNPVKGEVAGRVVEADRRYAENNYQEELWKRIRAHAPENKKKRRLWHLHGLGALWNMYSTSQGHCIAARTSFVSYCERVSRDDKYKWALFASAAFRLRLVEDDQTFRYLMVHITQKHISKTLIDENPVAACHEKVTDYRDANAIKEFLKQGSSLKVQVLDATLEMALLELQPIFKEYFFSQDGTILRSLGMDADAEISIMATVKLQSIVRVMIAKRKFKEKLAARGPKKNWQNSILYNI